MAVAAHHTADAVDMVAATAAALHEEVVTVVVTVAEEADRHTAHIRCNTRLTRVIPSDLGRCVYCCSILSQG
jgi:hypothetical protein